MAKLSDDAAGKLLDALGTIQGAVLVITDGGDKEEGECAELMRRVIGNKGVTLTSGDARQFTEATIRWCGERLGMQVEYPHRQRTWLDE